MGTGQRTEFKVIARCLISLPGWVVVSSDEEGRKRDLTWKPAAENIDHFLSVGVEGRG